MKNLIVATSNPGKLQEMQDYLTGIPWQLQLKPPSLEIEETGTTFRENAILKSSLVAKALGEWAIADDSGLAVNALNGRPGIYSARYGQDDGDRISRLLDELGDNLDRRAQFVCAVAIANPQGEIVLESQGICQGEILSGAQGENGFGYDPIFYVPSAKKTFAEMSPEMKRQLSHRGLAFAQIVPKLRDYIKSG
jgi:XTP/dITP diphosphohydrolase